jgi:putative addiction module component (TIGR02574 family)
VLTVPEKEALLATLLDALDGPPEEGVEAAWREEIDRRLRELDTGAVESISAEQVVSRIDRVPGQ